MTSTFKRLLAGATAIAALATPLSAQVAQPATDMAEVAQPERDSAASLGLSNDIVLFGDSLPTVVKATAIVNGDIITQTDVDQRVALTLIGSPPVPAEQVQLLRQQILRNLIDEVLQIKAAERDEIELADAEVESALERVAQSRNLDVAGLGRTLEENGSSLRSIRQQIKGELAWRRLQQIKIASFVSVGDDEVQSVIDTLEASKGQTEWNVSEIYLSATPATRNAVQQRAVQILEALRGGANFGALARQYSESSAAATGGNLGWIRPEQLPGELSSALVELQPGAVSVPIAIPGGYSILAVQDRRTILTADPRDAVLTLKQVSVPIAPGTSEVAANELVDRFAQAAQTIGGCGGAERLAADFNGQVVTQDGIVLRDLPPALQQMMIPMQVGQATRPFGSLDEAVRLLVICGRDEATPGLPSFDQVMGQITDERVNRRAQRYLRDLRRDAIIDFR